VTIDRHILLDSVFHHTIAGDNIWTSRCPISLQSFQKQNQLLIRSGLCLSSFVYLQGKSETTLYAMGTITSGRIF